MKPFFAIALLWCAATWTVLGQHEISINAQLHPETKTITVQQEIRYTNTASASLNELFFNDWANSFSTKTSPLAKRFAENFDSSFHFEKKEDRGATKNLMVTDANGRPLQWDRNRAVDILRVSLANPLAPNESVSIQFNYTVKVPDAKFTRFGATDRGEFRLRYWYLSPAVYNGTWQVYSNKNTDDLYAPPSQYNIRFSAPERYHLVSALNVISESIQDGLQTTQLYGENRTEAILYLDLFHDFETVVTDKFHVLTNLRDDKVTPPIRALVIDRVAHFLSEKLGSYPFDKMVVSEVEYRKNPVYGLNQLPDFISPFPDGFEYDMEQLKTMTREYLETTLPLHRRNDHWLIGALQIHLMMEYVDTYYPKMKIIGNLSNFWVIRWAHASDLEFNDQYPLLYLNMARNNLHQSLTTPRDSLVKFNESIANDYYGGKGLQYLKDYLGRDALSNTIKEFYQKYKLKPVSTKQFEEILKRNSSLPVDWFFENYIGSRKTIDFKIKKVDALGDSLRVAIKNKKHNRMPVSLYGVKGDSTVFKTWVAPFDTTTTVTIPSSGVEKLILNKEGVITEFNRRNNYKNLHGLLNRPLQFRLFQDVEDPDYNQMFFMPIFEYNLYDGFTVGPKLYNKTVLPKGIHYKLEPQYGFRSKTLVGSGSLVYTQLVDTKDLYSMRYGLSGSYFSYDRNLFYRRFTPFITFAFRNNDDLRDNEKQFINLRSVNVSRDDNPADPDQDPDYSVFNFQYVYSNPNLINYFRGVADYQISSKFSKVSVEFEYRKLFLNNRQLNLRFFAGAFLFNDTGLGEDYFSFALDRPTDYLFDYNYYGRSEDTGVFSQQLIIAEGGFKSQLEPAFSNSWLTTVNASTNIWKWIYAYGDVGMIHNTNQGADFVYDTGVRLSLVADYFELYFPVYSNLGFEPNLPNYDQRIRFIVTLSPKTLLGLFTRKWY
ncbi:MAG: metalloprotease [Flavobacteriaceae bacterium]|nr:metalloprotease [Flavobacteriaceae bacterium]